jgi:hypothetical protein
MCLGGHPCFLRRRVGKRFAALVSRRLDDFIEDISVLIDRSPQPMLFAAADDDDLVKVPDIAAARSLALEAAGMIARELHRPPPHRLVGDDNSALVKHLLDQAKAQREAKVHPHRMRDDQRRKPMALVADGGRSHVGDLHGLL